MSTCFCLSDAFGAQKEGSNNKKTKYYCWLELWSGNVADAGEMLVALVSMSSAVLQVTWSVNGDPACMQGQKRRLNCAWKTLWHLFLVEKVKHYQYLSWIFPVLVVCRLPWHCHGISPGNNVSSTHGRADRRAFQAGNVRVKSESHLPAVA